MIKINSSSNLKDYNFLETNTPFFIENPELLQRHKLALPPPDSYFFFPKGEEIIIPNKKKPEKSLRRIYFNTEYTNYEKNKIIEFKKIINSHKENLHLFPNYWNDSWNLMFIYSTDCDLEKGYNRMITYFKWYNNFFPLSFTPNDKAIEILNSGFAYCYGRDHEFRPILIVQPYIYQKNIDKFSNNDLMRASVFLCEYVKNNLLIPGQVENWNMIVNLRGTSVISIPDPIKKVISCLSDNFIAKLYKSYVLNLSLFLRILFKFMCAFLEEVTVRKIVVVGGKDDNVMLNFINGENLEKRFGGNAEDLDYTGNNLFPPRMPSSQKFLLDNENRNEVLISKKVYKELMKKLPKESLSPFILEEIENEKKEKEEKLRNIEREKMIKQKNEEDNNKKDILEMIQNINWEIKNEFPKKSFINKSKIPFLDIEIESFQNDIKNFNINKDKCNWILQMKSEQ